MDAAASILLWLVPLCCLDPGSSVLQAGGQLEVAGNAAAKGKGLAPGHHETSDKPDWLIQQLHGLQIPSRAETLPDSLRGEELPGGQTVADRVVLDAKTAENRDEYPPADISGDQQAGDDLLRLLARIAEKPAHWRLLHRTLQTLDHDLQVSRHVIQRMRYIEEAVDEMDDAGRADPRTRQHRKHRHEELRKKKTRHKQGSKTKHGEHRRRQQPEKTGLVVPPGEEDVRQTPQKINPSARESLLQAGSLSLPTKNFSSTTSTDLDSIPPGRSVNSPGEHKGGTKPEDVGGGDVEVHSLRHKQQMKNELGENVALSKNSAAPAAYEGSRRRSKVKFLEYKHSSRQGTSAHSGPDVNFRHRGKITASDNVTRAINGSREMVKDLGGGNSPASSLCGVVDENTTSPRPDSQDRACKWPDLPGGEASVRGATESDDNSLWPLQQQQRWSKPSALEAALEKQKALATNAWSARRGGAAAAQKPARHFTYRRVTTSPQLQRPRQRNALVAVSVASSEGRRDAGSTTPAPPAALPDKMDQLVQDRRADPLERQLADLASRVGIPWSHARHLDKIQEQLKSLSAMEQKLQYRWLEKQRLHQMLRDGGKERAISLGSDVLQNATVGVPQ